MKAISINEPWASMILKGKKTIETRTWKTKHRGPLLLCASKRPQSKISGMAFAVADLMDCRDMTIDDEPAACCKIYPSAKAWILINIRLIDRFPVKGKQGIFKCPIKGRYPPK